jgi:hypothetical protein
MSQPIFTQFDLLSPESMRAKLATAHGSEVWSNTDMLDPARQEAAVNALSASATPPFNNYRGINDSRWTPGSASAPDVDWSLADAIGSI